MTKLPASLPRATDVSDFYADPLAFLAEARARLGDIFVLREEKPLFSRHSDCTGVVAVFGAAHTQAVLTDIDVYGWPISAAEHLVLPHILINLNRGLHSMRDKQDDDQQRLLMQFFSNRSIDASVETIGAGLTAFASDWLAQYREVQRTNVRFLSL